jgi:hypothetical protein
LSTGILQGALSVQRITAPVLEGPMKYVHLQEPQQEWDLANGQATFYQVTHCELATHLG